MHVLFASAMVAALVATSATPAAAQVAGPAVAGPPAPVVPPEVRTGPLPAVLTLARALEEAERLGARVKAWDDGAWVREAALAHAAKQRTKKEAA